MQRKRPLTEVRKAVAAAKKKGYKLVCGGWGVEWDEDLRQWVSPYGLCCPLGAVLLIKQPKARNGSTHIPEEAATKVLRVSRAWIAGFNAAIDGVCRPQYEDKKQDIDAKTGYFAGLELRRTERMWRVY